MMARCSDEVQVCQVHIKSQSELYIGGHENFLELDLVKN